MTEPLTSDRAKAFADEWVAAWNARDLDRILSHYAPDVVFLSPIAQKRVGNGRMIGHAGLRAYWGPALAAMKDLRFELIKVFTGYAALTILYRNQLGEVTETFELGPDGKVVRSMACYAQ